MYIRLFEIVQPRNQSHKYLEEGEIIKLYLMSKQDVRICVKLLGKGSFAKVSLQLSKNNLIACKSIELQSEQSFEELLNQIGILKACRHPSIVRYTGFHMNSFQQFCIELEYVKGETLNQAYWNLEQPNEQLLLFWVFQIGLALHYIHRKSIVHRDIKPSNIICSEKGLIKIIDFGLSKIMVNHTTQITGSPYYMAPQIFNNRIIRSKSDIWSLGITVYELCHRRVPFDTKSNNFDEHMRRVNEEEIDYDRFLCSQEMESLLKAMLVKDYSNRLSAVGVLSHPVISKRVPYFQQIYKQITIENRVTSKCQEIDAEYQGSIR